jgi:hypothetical protein
MHPHEWNILRETTALRTAMMEQLTDTDLAFALPKNPTLGELCREQGEVERMYIESFRTLRMPWGTRTAEAGIESSVEQLKAWYARLDAELYAALEDIPDADFQTKSVDRAGGFFLPLGAQMHTYRESLLIFCGKWSVYLIALGKPLNEQWRGWIG